MKRRRLVAGACALVLTLSACTRVQTAQGNGASVHSWTNPQVLRVGAYEEPDSLNPVITSMSFASDVFQLIYDGLIRYDERGRAVPDLAREVPSRANGGISPDGRTLTYHLMPHATWSDGAPVTSADVAFTFHALMNPNNNVPTRIGYDRIVRIETPDPLTVRVVLNAPYAPALYLFKGLAQGAIVPKHVLEKYPDINRVAFNTHPVTSGPYLLRSWEHGTSMHFDANPSYFRGAPKIPHVVFTFIPDQNTLLSQLRTHEIDLAYDFSPYSISQLRNLPGVVVTSASTLHWEHMAFNVKQPPLDDRRVRLALCYGMDERSIFDNVYHGMGRPGPTDQNPDYGWSDKSLDYWPYDPARAAALLDAAGWRMGADGIRHKAGRPLELVISTVNGVKTRESIEVILQSEWRKLGVQLDVKNYPAPTLFAPAGAGGLLYGGKTQITIFTWADSIPDPDDETFTSPDMLPPKGQNVSFYQNARIRTAQQAALRTYDPVVRKRYYLQIQRILLDEVPQYTFDWLPEIDAANVDLHGLKPSPVGSDFWNIADWTFGGGAQSARNARSGQANGR